MNAIEADARDDSRVRGAGTAATVQVEASPKDSRAMALNVRVLLQALHAGCCCGAVDAAGVMLGSDSPLRADLSKI